MLTGNQLIQTIQNNSDLSKSDLVSNDNTLKSNILEEKFKDILDTFYSKLEEANCTSAEYFVNEFLVN